MKNLLLIVALISASAAAHAQLPQQIPTRGNLDFDSILLQPKIIGGQPAPAGSYPWQVSLQRSDIQDPVRAHYCGASIRDSIWLVTAAHCAVNLLPSDVVAVAGTQTLSASSPRLRIKRILVNKSFNAATYENDIALMMLDQPLVLGSGRQSIPPMSTAEEATLAPGTLLYVTGWGATAEGGPVVRTLRNVPVPFVPTSDCNNPFSYGGRVTDGMLCAGDAQGGRDSCQGDSGGPLSTASGGNGAKLIGIVSWGEGCAKAGKPGVYARVSVLNSWIEQCIANPDACQ